MSSMHFPVLITADVTHMYDDEAIYFGYFIGDNPNYPKCGRTLCAKAGETIYPIGYNSFDDSYLFSVNPEHGAKPVGSKHDFSYFCFYGTAAEISKFTDNEQLFAAILSMGNGIF